MARGRKTKILTLPDDIKGSFKEFRDALYERMITPTLSSAYDAETIRIILEDLDDVERNLILAYYGTCEGDIKLACKLFKTTQNTFNKNFDKIIEKIKSLNNVSKTTYNCARECDNY